MRKLGMRRKLVRIAMMSESRNRLPALFTAISLEVRKLMQLVKSDYLRLYRWRSLSRSRAEAQC